jgi:hypothetical protein
MTINLIQNESDEAGTEVDQLLVMFLSREDEQTLTLDDRVLVSLNLVPG